MNLGKNGFQMRLASRLVLAALGGTICSAALAAGNDVTLAEVKVTGEKIERSIKETTTAVTVLNDGDVDAGDTRSVAEVAARVPNMVTNPYGVTNIRGVDGTGVTQGAYTFVSGARPRVSTLVDGVAESWSGQNYVDVGMWDVEQVEVLRGPQSTLQGRNSLAGAMVVKTKDPTFVWEGGARVGYENEGNKTQAAVMLSGPIVKDQLAFRIAAEGVKGDGYIDYPMTGASWPFDPAESTRKQVRAKLLYTPSDNRALTAKLTLTHREQEGEYLNFVNGNFSDYQLSGNTSNTRIQDSKNTTLTSDIDYKFNPALTGQLTLSHTSNDTTFEQAGANSWNAMTLSQNEKQYSAESRLVYKPQDRGISGVAGIHLFQRDQDLNAGPDTFDGTDQLTTWAVYGESTIPLGNVFNVNVGARIERERQQRDIDAWPGTAWAGHVLTNKGETMLLPKLGVSYDWTPETTLGLSVRKGYTPGGGGLDWKTSVFYEYDKEEVLTWEATSRSNFFGNRMSLNTTLFFNQYQGYQANVANTTDRIQNLDRARSYGLEIESTAKVNRDLEVFGSVGTLNSEITSGKLTEIDVTGKEMSYAPSFTANLGFKQQLPLGLFVGGNANYVGEYYSDVANAENLKAGDYTVVNANAGWSNKMVTVRAYVKNLTDKLVIYRQNASGEAQVGAPRTFGVTVDYKF